jgi:hypothetical protein
VRPPQVFYDQPVAQAHVAGVLRRAAALVGPGKGRLALDPSVQASKQGRFRLRLMTACVFEAYAWMPPTAYHNEVLFGAPTTV